MGWVVGSYPLSSQAPTPVEVELGCDNSQNMDKLVLIVLLFKIRPLVGQFNISNILRPGYDPASLPSDLVNVQVGN